MTQPDDESQKVHDHVNVIPNGPTEDDEERILESLYGPVDEDGFYRGPEVE